ncbi:hypothetical protein DAPPUDRAFT_104899 [Daphnia pulex]|uniref:Uncharacterized protein n=1 Tax=Daphnia pulex TaxID=6669 RepID=E9GNQ2_DAPPU|nr:hypothetical protein DAPPUDRAFT_104899 [Daphnia pulex]|eukprot:EFX78919.1 hypothetical protein DAPPUDRAFT_104899 [Daphnia pulex]
MECRFCMTWRKERTTTGYFFGAFDTIDSISTTVTTKEECKHLVNTHMCDGNKMKEISKNSYEYKGSPIEKGTWMQKITETKKNCATKKVILHRDCLTCPVMSPFGVLTNKTEVTTVITRDVTITWEDPILQKDEKCKLKKVISATGVITEQEDGSFKMIDELNQLEFHYEERPYDFCNHTFYKLSNLRNAYIELPKIADQQAMLLFNRTLPSSTDISLGYPGDGLTDELDVQCYVPWTSSDNPNVATYDIKMSYP